MPGHSHPFQDSACILSFETTSLYLGCISHLIIVLKTEGAAMTGAAQLAEAEQRAPAHGWWPLAVISAAQLMAILDTTVMFVALPSAQHAVGLSVGARQWIITAYTLAFAALLLVGGRLADRLGARVTLLAGVIGFALASAAGGASLDGAMLLAARAGQGASAPSRSW
jgi:predicted MFS family arabinose efflux permease